MTCPVCRYPLIPGVTSCVNCGSTPGDGDREWFDSGFDPEPTGVSAEQIAAWKEANRAARETARQLTEARALEYAGDVDGAAAIYERMVSAGSRYTPPYRRLAIIHRKAKRPDDEERVVRAALGHLSAGANGWFIVRLAKILAEQRKRTG